MWELPTRTLTFSGELIDVAEVIGICCFCFLKIAKYKRATDKIPNKPHIKYFDE